MKPFIVDSHTHIQFSAYDEDRKEVLDRALEQNIWTINSGSNSVNSEAAVKLAESYEAGVYATVGIHPSHAAPLRQGFAGQGDEINEDSGSESFNKEKMTRLAASKKVVAIGECGLEYFREYDAKSQKELFTEHINFAYEVKKPLVIHCREAYADTYDILLANKDILSERGGLMHFFSGSVEDMAKFLDLGFYFSFGGAITFPSKVPASQSLEPGRTNFERLLRALPMDRILLETDAPYVAPQPYRGKRNEPAYIVEVARKVAEMKGITMEEAASATTDNALRLFAIEA
ncbi:MAG: TatD family hydrolase [Candidatus Colwellbacteria bacterium]|nr:TatD family hydrolase [Candidatus Colwellbacteria bacterium]